MNDGNGQTWAVLFVACFSLGLCALAADPICCDYASPDVAGGPSALNPQDGVVDVQDFLWLLGHMNHACPNDIPSPGCCRGDLNLDCEVGIEDWLYLLSWFGQYDSVTWAFVTCG